MDSSQIDVTDNIEEFIKERGDALPSILKVFAEETEKSKLLEHIQLSLKYLPTFDITVVDSEILQYIMPVIKKSLQKTYNENFVLSETADDELVLFILKQNLQVAINFVQILKKIVEFILQSSEIELLHINSVAVNLAKSIFFTFEHWKNSSQTYKDSFKLELLELLYITQEVHPLFLRLIEKCVIIGELFDNEIEILREVLDDICHISEVLSVIHIKSMADNWKGFTAIMQKFVNVLGDSINLKLPIKCLTSEIHNNLISLAESATADETIICQNMIKITGFLIKVILKLLDIFWQYLENICIDLLNFCCIIYSYPVDLYESKHFPVEVIEMINNLLFKSIEPFAFRLTSKETFLKNFEETNTETDKIFKQFPYGCLNFLNTVLRALTLKQQRPENTQIHVILKTIFDVIPLCPKELFWKTEQSDGIFQNLIINVTAVIIIYEKYEQAELILLENLLHENIWNSLLALEIWCLFLSNASQEICFGVLVNLIENVKKCDFGIFTARPEKIYLKHLLHRIFDLLSNINKIEITKKYVLKDNTEIWKLLGLGNYPVQQAYLVENVVSSTVERIEEMDTNFSLNDLINIAESLEILSTVKFKELGLNSRRLVNSVCNLWEIDLGGNIMSNNIFKYFINKLGKTTTALIEEFHMKQLNAILKQLKTLSLNDTYKLLICDVLCKFACPSFAFMFDFDRQSKQMMFSHISNIIEDLLKSNNHVIKQNTFELIQRFANSSQYDPVVKDIMKSLNQDEIQAIFYSEGNVKNTNIDYEYLKLISTFKFQHKCITWSQAQEMIQPLHKKIRMEENVNAESQEVEKQPIERTLNAPKDVRWHIYKENIDRMSTSTSRKPSLKENSSVDRTSTYASDDCATEVIARMKDEVKCLTRVLKTETLSRKNVADLKIIASQLQSFI